MPIKIGKKSHPTFSSAAKAIAKKKGWSMKRASAYVAVVEAAQQGKKIGRKAKAKTSRRRK